MSTADPLRPFARTLALGMLAVALGAPPPATAQDRDEDEGLPLEVDRTIRIDMTEGTWMSVDVSPDGRTIVFDHLGDLFLLPFEGGDARRLTSGMALDAQPRFSPDGTRVAFTSDRSGGQNVWIMALDGSDTVMVTRGETNRTESPEWTPDGNYIVSSFGGFRGGGLPKLRINHVDGGSGTMLIDEPNNLKTIGAAFGPDGRWIWFARRTGDWTYNAPMPQYQLAVYDRETGEIYSRSSRWGSAFRPTLSPDGRWLVYGTRHEDQTGLRLRDLSTGEERWLAYPVQRDDQESRATLDVLPGMSFTPDSEWLVASWGGKLWRVPIAGGDAVEIPFRVAYDLAVGPVVDFDYPIEDTPTFTVRQIRDAVPSPDGSRIAFTALDRLWVASADGSNARRLTDDAVSEHYPAWSPDGAWVAYVTWEGGTGHVYRMRSDGGGQPQQVSSEPGIWVTPAWSPDGARIVALRGSASSYRESAGGFGGGSPSPTEIVWLSATGGPSAATLIAPTDGRRGPHFGSSPDRIYLHDAGDDVLVSIRWDGTDEREHVRVTGPRPPGSDSGLDPDVLRMAPRGDQAMALIEGQIYTVTVPQLGAEAAEISVANPRNASFPARHLTDMGGEFPTWSADAGSVHWSLGNAFFTYDLAAADAAEEAAEDRRAAAEEEEQEEEEEDQPAYSAEEVRVVIEAARDIPRGAAVFRGARIITMRGDEVVENADLVVRDNRIVAVGARGSVDVPSDARVIDVSGRTIVPGFVDTHAHMRPSGQVHRNDVWPYLANLAFGVTTTRDPQTGTTDVLSYSDRVRTGDLIGPRIYSTGPGIFWQDDIDSAEKARDILSKYSDYFDTKTIKMYVAGARRGRQLIIEAARELGLMPTTEGSLNIRQNISETIDGYPGHEHSLPIYPLYDDVVQLFRDQGRTYTPTLLVSYGGPWAENYYYSRENPHDEQKVRRFMPHEVVDAATLRRGQWFREDQHVFEDHARFARDLVEAGGRVGVGSHGQFQGLGYHWELWSIQSGGMAEHDALRVATILGAEAIGLDTDIGSLEPGKMADLVVLEANPLDDIRNTNRIESVMVNGRLYDADTLDEVYPRQRTLEPLWWWDDEPTDVPGVGR